MLHDECKIRVDRIYEAAETAFVKAHLKPGDLFVDVGAHIGYYSVLASGLVGPRGRVFAFEPDPMNHAKLEDNTMPLGNVVAIHRAVSDFVGLANLHLSDSNSGDHRLFAVEGRRTEKVSVTSLDVWFPMQKINFLKIDVQGVEMSVLRGAEKLIARSPGLVGIVEFTPWLLRMAGVRPIELPKWFIEHGFSLTVARSGIRVDPQQLEEFCKLKRHVNLLFQKKC